MTKYSFDYKKTTEFLKLKLSTRSFAIQMASSHFISYRCKISNLNQV